MKKTLIIIASFVLAAGCGPEFRSVPPGYIGKVLTPTGWQSKLYEAGMIDLGRPDVYGRQNTAVLCEATSKTIEELFRLEGQEDHRIVTSGGVPLDVEVRLQVMLPDDEKSRNSIYATVTPDPVENDQRMKIVELADIYTRFGQGPVRNKIRSVFSKRKDFDEITRDYDAVSAEISRVVAATFKEAKVPLVLLAADLSRVKPDSKIQDAVNLNAASESKVKEIEQIGEAMRKNPQFLEKYKWDVIRDSAKAGSTIIVDATDDGKIKYTVPAK